MDRDAANHDAKKLSRAGRDTTGKINGPGSCPILNRDTDEKILIVVSTEILKIVASGKIEPDRFVS
jgi:hypothetical protein